MCNLNLINKPGNGGVSSCFKVSGGVFPPSDGKGGVYERSVGLEYWTSTVMCRCWCFLPHKAYNSINWAT